jgi:hypothetical protein
VITLVDGPLAGQEVYEPRQFSSAPPSHPVYYTAPRPAAGAADFELYRYERIGGQWRYMGERKVAGW